MALPREAIMQIPEKQLVASWRAGDKEAFTLVYARYEQEDESSFVEDKGIVKTVRVVRIKGIYPNSPAFRSGLLPGDKILHLNGTPTFTNVGFGLPPVAINRGRSLMWRYSAERMSETTR